MSDADLYAAKSASLDRPAVDVSLLILRAIVGFVFAYHGYPKVFEGGMHEMANNLGFVAYLVAIGEFFGGAGIIVGVLTRFSAAANIVIMIGAIVMVHGAKGFSMAGGGYEYNLVLIAMLAPILIAGPGHYALGRFLPLPKSARTGRPVMPLE